MTGSEIKKIVVIGNIAGGKTRLSRILATRYQVPVLHIDAIQFTADMQIQPAAQTREVILSTTAQEAWLVDGYGPLEIFEKRLLLADRIVLIDFPLWRHYWWCAKRQISLLWTRRAELPPECNERTWAHTQKLFKTIKQMHTKMRPELLRILNREHLRQKTIQIGDLKTWNHVAENGL